MKISKIKSIFALLTGGISGLIKYLLDVFNTQVLSRIKDRDCGTKYIKDAQAISAFIKSILDNHANDLTEKRKEAICSILAAIDELAKALEDFEVNREELDAIIDKVQEAIDTWKKSK